MIKYDYYILIIKYYFSGQHQRLGMFYYTDLYDLDILDDNTRGPEVNIINGILNQLRTSANQLDALTTTSMHVQDIFKKSHEIK